MDLCVYSVCEHHLYGRCGFGSAEHGIRAKEIATRKKDQFLKGELK